MQLTITKIEKGGVSNVDKITTCARCHNYTDKSTGPAVRLHLWLDTPRGAETHDAVLTIHVRCLMALVSNTGWTFANNDAALQMLQSGMPPNDVAAKTGLTRFAIHRLKTKLRSEGDTWRK